MSSHGSRVLSMAGGTLASRLTGLLRVLVLAWVLGFTPLADAYNLANTVPNMLFDLVLGGVASATFIPVFVERLALDGERRAWKSISSVVSAASLILALATALTWLAAPWIITAFTSMHHVSVSGVALAHQRDVAASLLRWFAPQVFFYGLISLATALLNVRHRFGAPAWTPVANNVVCIAVLVWFHLVDPTPTLATLSGSHELLWLGLGTTLGVAVQFLLLVPSLMGANLSRLSLRLDLADPALRAVARLGSWTLLVVVANQVSLFVVLAFAFGTGVPGAVSAYTYGWSFMQMPYAVVVVSVLSALTPQLASLATAGDAKGLSSRLRFGMRQSLVIIVPSTLVLLIVSQPLVAILLHRLHGEHTLAAGTVLAMLAAGLPGFTIFQICVRGLQASQRARQVFYLYAFENAATILIALVIGRHSLGGLCASVSLAYSAAAVLALFTLSRYDLHVSQAIWSVHVRRSLVASLAAVLAIALTYATSTATEGAGLLVRFGLSLLAGGVVYLASVALGARRLARRAPKGERLRRY